MCPVGATAIPVGELNCPLPVPNDPHWVINVPPGENSWMRLFPVSATYTFPAASVAKPCGALVNCPGPAPAEPHWVRYGGHCAEAVGATATAYTSRLSANNTLNPPDRIAFASLGANASADRPHEQSPCRAGWLRGHPSPHRLLPPATRI